MMAERWDICDAPLTPVRRGDFPFDCFGFVFDIVGTLATGTPAPGTVHLHDLLRLPVQSLDATSPNPLKA